MAIIKKFRITSFKREKSLISLENISVAFKKNHQILDNVSLKIPKGQILGLLGPNGAGKSTLMNVISGLVKPNYGKVKIDNIDISNLPIYIRTKKFKISIIPQFGGLFESLTIEQNIRAVAEILLKDKSFVDIKINELIAKFELESVKKIEAKYLSGGQKKRLVIAMGLISKPDIILMDEPLAALDPQTIQMLQNTIVNLQSDLNLTIIITDHQARDLLAICDKAIILSNSKIIASGSPNDLMRDESANKFYFGKNFQFNWDMSNSININNKINSFNKTIKVPGDKSLSIRWVLFSSIAKGKSKAYNLLLSEDVIAAINAVKKFGIKVKLNKKHCNIVGNGADGYDYKKSITINAKNSGTLGRLIAGILIDSPYKIKIIGDKSLSKRDFTRIANPLKKFGADIKLTNKGLPLTIKGNKNPLPINYLENKGSAQVKSSIILAGLKTEGKTFIKCKPSRDHTELLCKYLKLPLKVIKKKNYDLIEVKKAQKIKPLSYNIPSDISSAAFFIVLTALSSNSKLLIKDVNINPSRIGIITILKKMAVNIQFKNKKNYKGEMIADILIVSTKKLKAINCPTKLNSGAIDEFLIIFLVAAKASGVSYFKDIGELNQKESPRLKWGARILNKMGIKTIATNSSIKIFGNPNLKISKRIVIKDYLKDHRVFMTSVIAASVFGGTWKIHDQQSIKTSFPTFLNIIKDLKNKSKNHQKSR